MVLVHHERTSSLDLSFKDSIPELLSRDSLASTAFLLITLIQSLELVAVDLMETRGLIRAEERPFTVSLDALHAAKRLISIIYASRKGKDVQKIRNPESIEEIASANFFLAVVLAEVKELKDIRVPWLEVDSEGTRTLVASLVDIASSGIIGTQHGHDTIRVPISASNVRPANPIVRMQTHNTKG